jgi:sugar phosphate isomerase/epimerase
MSTVLLESGVWPTFGDRRCSASGKATDVHVGLKLDPGFSTDEAYREVFGARDILAYLREAGVQAVETPLTPETDGRDLIEHIRGCAAAGLRVSLHPYTEATPFNPAAFAVDDDNPCREFHERVFATAAAAARLQQSQATVNIHPAAGPRSAPRHELVSRSVEFFRWAIEWRRVQGASVAPVAELQIRPAPAEPMQRIGDRYSELLEVAGRSGVGICWDFGHAFMNTRRFGEPLDPPVDMLVRTVHAHCHDVDRVDHHPLVFDRVPWRRFLKSLIRNGFDGTVVLEVPPRNFLAAGGLVSLEQSVDALRSSLEPGP